MTAKEFIKKLKEEIHKNNYKTSELDVIDIKLGVNKYEVYLYDKNLREPVYVEVKN